MAGQGFEPLTINNLTYPGLGRGLSSWTSAVLPGDPRLIPRTSIKQLTEPVTLAPGDSRFFSGPHVRLRSYARNTHIRVHIVKNTSTN